MMCLSIDVRASSLAMRISSARALDIPTNSGDRDLGSSTSSMSTMITTLLSRPLNEWIVEYLIHSPATSSVRGLSTGGNSPTR